ncbi:MAG: hypothetical protein GY769_09510 [bacterium]|nr:hypothetical protein [bacterium]
MATAERVLWETVTVVVFLLLLAGTVLWSGSRVERHRGRLEAEFDAKIATAAEEQRRITEELGADFERRSHEYRVREAEAVFHAFEAGVRSAVASRWGNYANRAKSNLLEDSRVSFVHILTPAGLILASSDEKMARTGRVDERGDWALATTELTTRDGTVEGSIELAGPMYTNGRPIAFLWLGYDLADSDTSDASAGSAGSPAEEPAE